MRSSKAVAVSRLIGSVAIATHTNTYDLFIGGPLHAFFKSLAAPGCYRNSFTLTITPPFSVRTHQRLMVAGANHNAIFIGCLN